MGYKTETEEFAEKLAESYRTVRFNKETERGRANLGAFTVEFWEHGNDSAVCINITANRRWKGSAENALEALEALAAVMRNSD